MLSAGRALARARPRLACCAAARTILASTDTIAVIATVRKVRAPQRLATIIENASAFDDGAALVAFAAVLTYVERGRFDPRQGALELLWVVCAALGLGVLIGYVRRSSRADGRPPDGDPAHASSRTAPRWRRSRSALRR